MRHVYCATCGERHPSGRRTLPAADGDPAEHLRVIRGTAATPRAEQRIMYLNDEPFPLELEAYNCDLCNAPIRPGDPAVCVTVWIDRRPEPPAWESDFLRVIRKERT